MSTRNLTIVKLNGDIKVAQYGSYDGSPRHQGRTILRFLNTVNIEDFKKKLNNCSWITKDEIDAVWKSVGCDSKYPSEKEEKEFLKQLPSINNELGANVLYLINRLNGKVKLYNKYEFLQDSLCDWAYEIDFDTMKLKVYNGGSEPIKVYDINNLPSSDDFISELTAMGESVKTPMSIKQLNEEFAKILNEDVMYNVTLEKYEPTDDEGTSDFVIYDSSEEVYKKEAIEKAKEFIAKYADSDDFWMAKVDKGTIDWKYNDTNFDGNYVYAISNKDEKTTLDILGDSALWEIEKLVFLK